MLSALQSLWTWLAIGVLIVLWLPLLAVIRLFDRDPAHYRTGRWFRRLGLMITKVNPAWKIEISGEEIEDPRRPYVVVCNHLSNADIPIVSCLPWEMKWVAKAELFRLPFIGWMLRLAGDIPVDRKNRRSRAQVLFDARDVLQNKCSVMFFPEGTRSRDGRLYKFNEGAFRLAIKMKVPVLPLALDGSQDALPKHSWTFGRAESIRLKVLPPVPTAGLKADDVGTLHDRVRDAILAQVAAWRGTAPAEIDAAPERRGASDTPITPARGQSIA